MSRNLSGSVCGGARWHGFRWGDSLSVFGGHVGYRFKVGVLLALGLSAVCSLVAGEQGQRLNREHLVPAVSALMTWRVAEGFNGHFSENVQALDSFDSQPLQPIEVNNEGAPDRLGDEEALSGVKDEVLSSKELISNGPPLAPSGPASNRNTYFRLKEFKFPDEADVLASAEIEKNSQYEKSILELKQSLIGSSAERSKVAKKCKKILDSLEDSASLKTAPLSENLGCSYYRLQRLSKDLESENKLREKQEEALFEHEREVIVRQRNGAYPRSVKSQDDWNRLVGLSYRQSITKLRFSGKHEAERVAQFALQDPEPCATAGARSGIIRALEDYLPDEKIFETMAALYLHQKKCLRPSDDSFEEIHLRMGLLFLERSRLEEAGTSLTFALADRQGRDVYRALFWRGLLEAMRTESGHSLSSGAREGHVPLNSYWRRLIADHPLSFHALVADSITGYSLHKEFRTQESPWVAMYSGAEWDAHNYASLLFSLMIARNEKRMLKVFGKYVIRALEPVSFEQGMYFGLAQKEAEFTRGAIQAMFIAVSRFGSSRVNLEVLGELYPRFYTKELQKYGNNVDLALALSLMRQESSFNPQAASAARARGLMQVLPGTARMMMRRKNVNLFDPVQNIQAGTLYLKHLLERYNENYVHTIASYNAGPGKVAKWKTRYLTQDPLLFADLMPYRETRNYVAGLLRNIHWYRVLINGDNHQELISSADSQTWTARSLVPDPKQWGIDSLVSPIDLVFEAIPDFSAAQ